MRIRIGLNEMSQMVRESVRRVLNEDIADFGSKNGKEGKDEVLKEYDVISFANKFYTLWNVIERKYTVTYIFRKNISFSKEKAMELYPDAEFKEGLRGKSRSFTVSKLGNGDGEYRGEMLHIPQINVEQGRPVSFERFFVTSVSMKTTKYNKPYTCIEGEDLDRSTYFPLVISVFGNKGNGPLPKEGDIMKVEGTMGFIKDNGPEPKIYLNDCRYEITNGVRTTSATFESGEKISKRMVIKSMQFPKISRGILERAGIVVFIDEDGNEFYIEAVSEDYGTMKPVYKFDMAEMSVGDMYDVSGQVKDVNGFYRLLRPKLALIQKNDEAEGQNPEERELRFMVTKESYFKGKTNVNMKNYQMMESDMDVLLDYIMDLKNEHGAQIDCNYHVFQKPQYSPEDQERAMPKSDRDINTKEELADMFRESIRAMQMDRSFWHGSYVAMQIILSIPQTKEKLYYQITPYFKNS